MTMLGGIELSNDLVISGLESAPDIVYNPLRLVTGELFVQTAPVIGGRVLSLKGKNAFTLQQIVAIKVIAAMGQAVPLIHHRGTFNFLITGTPVEPVIEYADPDPDEWYDGEITGIAL